jgi:hypothetical protein
MASNHQRIFQERAVNLLQASVRENLLQYNSDDVWADRKDLTIESRLDSLSAVELLMPSQEGTKDIDNAKILFLHLRKLDRTQAADSRLWTYLCHVTFWRYMRKRWDVQKSSSKDKTDYVLEHYFIKSDQSRSLSRNGIARLWWYGFLTYDEARENPFQLTEVLLSQLDIAQQVLERSLGRNKSILHGFLDFLSDKPELTSGGNKGRQMIREMATSLNTHGGVCLLDCLDTVEVADFLNRRYALALERDRAETPITNTTV